MTASLTLCTAIAVILCIPMYGDILGFCSLSIEATLGFPQMISNFKSKSTEGLSMFMIFTWFSGDFFKTLYFIIEKQPIPFIMCGTVQLTVDIIIVCQIIYYTRMKNYEVLKNK